ncbi:MAG: hypothetical protein U0840_00600 [Gemmataceae bacterium]
MNFSDRLPSDRWSALKYRGELFAEVWFKPEGDPQLLAFRILRDSYHRLGLAQVLTGENLLRAVGISTDALAEWHLDDQPAPSDDPVAQLRQPLPPPAEGEEYLHLRFRQQLAPTAGDPAEADAEQIPEAWWQEIESRWNAVLTLEASIDTLRISMEGLRSELESLANKSLRSEEKVHALNADIAQWTKAKSRVVYAVPKVKDFIHRSTWVTGSPERKQLEELVKNFVRPRLPFPNRSQVLDQIANLLKDRQVLSALGTASFQECKGVVSEVNGALRTLQTNAASNATRKRGQNNSRSNSH